jgi:MYXO-CTERM domain-containing protein
MAMNDEESENPLEANEGPAKRAMLGSSRREPGGCASCAIAGGADPLAALALAGLALMLASRRRHRR